MSKNYRHTISAFFLFFMLVAAALISGCGGGRGDGITASGGTSSGTTTTGSNPSATGPTVTGTAAIGAAMAGATITIKDSAGTTKSGTAAADGTFSIVVAGLTPPFMLQAEKGATDLYSFLASMDMTATGTKNVNITPITNLIVFEMNGKADPGYLYWNTGKFKALTGDNVAAAQNVVRGVLPLSSISTGFDMMYDKFVVGSSAYDAALDSLQVTQSGARVTYMNGTTQVPYSSGTFSGTSPAPSVTLTLTDPTSGATMSSISGSTPAKLTAIVRDANGIAVPNAVVIFTTDPAYGSFTPSSAALTDSAGAASTKLNAVGTSGGASTATVTTQVQVNGSPVTVTGSLNYGVGATNGISLSAVTFPGLATGSLSAYGTAGVSVTINNATAPLAVSFTSGCASNGMATLTPTVTSIKDPATGAWVARASYLDNGCNSTDTVTATVNSGVSSSGNLVVNSPSAGSIQFVSATPTNIALKGTGGVGRLETSRVTFRVLDTAGHPFGNQIVSFFLNNSAGGLHLSSASAPSDPTTGNVVTDVISGSISTVVRVTAITGTISSLSDLLVISTGIPSQDNISISASQHNIEGWDWDGAKTTLTARLADHFHNPVPDGTAVYFTSEGGSIVPSCLTVGGVCSVDMSSQNLRPYNGRVTVLARATGEEAFTDLNGNGTADPGELVDSNGNPSSLGEAFVDYNENGVRDPNEPYFDFNFNGVGLGVYNGPDPNTYHGLLCTTPGTGICSAQKTVDVRASQIIVFSTEDADITFSGNNITTAADGTKSIALQSCAAGGASSSFNVTVVDKHGNAMAAGTTISFSTSNGLILSDTSFTVPDTTGCRSNHPIPPGYAGYIAPGNPGYPAYSDCPASAASPTFGDYLVTMKNDTSLYDTYCYNNPSAPQCVGYGNNSANVCYQNFVKQGDFKVTVTSQPKGKITTASIVVNDD